MAWTAAAAMPLNRLRLRIPPWLYRRVFGATGAEMVVPRSILVVREGDMSDLAVLLERLVDLRSIWPLARITLLASAVPGKILWGNRLVDEVVIWGGVPRTGYRLSRIRARRTVRALTARHGRFDLVVLPCDDAVGRAVRRVVAGAARALVEVASSGAAPEREDPVENNPVQNNPVENIPVQNNPVETGPVGMAPA